MNLVSVSKGVCEKPKSLSAGADLKIFFVHSLDSLLW